MPFKDKSRYQSEEYKEYQRNYQRRWHQRHKIKRNALIRERKEAINEYIQSIKSQLLCVDCGQQHPATLHFHHLNAEDKQFNIGEAARKGFGPNRIKKEIEKCIVLCASCHAIRHYNIRNKKQTSPGIAGEFEELNTLLALNPETEKVIVEQQTQFPVTRVSQRRSPGNGLRAGEGDKSRRSR